MTARKPKKKTAAQREHERQLRNARAARYREKNRQAVNDYFIIYREEQMATDPAGFRAKVSEYNKNYRAKRSKQKGETGKPAPRKKQSKTA